MQRRDFTLTGVGTLGALLLLATTQARALSLPGLSNADASSGVKAALEQGAIAAVGLLGQSGGFLNNPSVRIPLPGYLDDAAQMMKRFGQGKRIEELETSLNRAAEAAVPMGKDLLLGAVQSMSITDAKNILTGGDTSVTQFFSSKTRAPLGEKFLPIVTQATSQVGLAQQYSLCRQSGGLWSGEKRRRAHRGLRHRRNAGRPVHGDWRARAPTAPKPGGCRQRPAAKGVWLVEVTEVTEVIEAAVKS